MANTSEVAERVVFMRIGQLFALCEHSPPPRKHASENVPGSMESKLLDWSSNRTTLNPIPAAFELHGDFESCFIRRVSHKLSGGEDFRHCLPRGLHPRSSHQIPHGVRTKGETPKISSQLDAMPVQSHRVWIGDPSVVRFHWSRRLTRDHLSIVSLHYIFDSNMMRPIRLHLQLRNSLAWVVFFSWSAPQVRLSCLSKRSKVRHQHIRLICCAVHTMWKWPIFKCCAWEHDVTNIGCPPHVHVS